MFIFDTNMAKGATPFRHCLSAVAVLVVSRMDSQFSRNDTLKQTVICEKPENVNRKARANGPLSGIKGIIGMFFAIPVVTTVMVYSVQRCPEHFEVS